MILRDEAHRILLERKDALVRLAAAHRADEDELLAQREADWEDAAADLRDARVLARLAEGERRELGEIDRALSRIDRGVWGKCTGCGRRIAGARLRARPESALCRTCAETAGLRG